MIISVSYDFILNNKDFEVGFLKNIFRYNDLLGIYLCMEER